MKLYLDCIPCFQNQALFATRGQDNQIRSKILKEVINLLNNMSWEVTPDEISQKVYNLVAEETGIEDPYIEIKKKSNQMVLDLYPTLKKELEKVTGRDRLYLASRLAIGGNIIDYGPSFDFDLVKTLEEVSDKEVAINDIDILFNKIISAKSLLYFADNAGEIVLDKLFIEEMIKLRGVPFEHITFVVKGAPIINDAMIDDAYEAGIDKLPNVVFYKLGNGREGTGFNRRDPEVKHWIKEHDLIISKGQANFEGLSENNNIFFMLIAKCPKIAEELGVNVMDMVIKYQ